jgi:hypothetical protein
MLVYQQEGNRVHLPPLAAQHASLARHVPIKKEYYMTTDKIPR